jgi:hypothetical protein
VNDDVACATAGIVVAFGGLPADVTVLNMSDVLGREGEGRVDEGCHQARLSLAARNEASMAESYRLLLLSLMEGPRTEWGSRSLPSHRLLVHMALQVLEK